MEEYLPTFALFFGYRSRFPIRAKCFLRGVIWPEFYIMTASADEIDDPAAVSFVFRAINSGYPVIGPIKESLMRVLSAPNDAPSMITDFIDYYLKRLTRL